MKIDTLLVAVVIPPKRRWWQLWRPTPEPAHCPVCRTEVERLTPQIAKGNEYTWGHMSWSDPDEMLGILIAPCGHVAQTMVEIRAIDHQTLADLLCEHVHVTLRASS